MFTSNFNKDIDILMKNQKLILLLMDILMV